MSTELRFTRTPGNFVSESIRAFTRSDWSHVEYKFADGYLGAHIDGGVLLRPFDYDPKCEFLIARVDCSPEVSARVEAAVRSEIGKPYDLTALCGILAWRDWHKMGAWFCSELFEWGFESSDYPLLRDGRHYNRVTPQDIFESELVIIP